MKKHNLDIRINHINKSNQHQTRYFSELSPEFRERLSGQTNRVLMNTSSDKKHILLVQETTTSDVFKGIKELYAYKKPDTYTFTYKTIVFGNTTSKNKLFNYIDIENDLDIKSIENTMNQILKWFLEQE